MLFVVLLSPCASWAARLPNGMVSYNGNDWFLPIDMVEDYQRYRTTAIQHFSDIRSTFGFTTVRFLVQPRYPNWPGAGGPAAGLDFPHPRQAELDNLALIIDDAYAQGLSTFVVVIIPKEYYPAQWPDTLDCDDSHALPGCSPNSLDVHYAKNGQTLIRNLWTYWDHVFNEVLRPRINKIAYIDVMGDFDPFQLNAGEWWRRIWPNFYVWYTDSSPVSIPVEKKTFEMMLTHADPVMGDGTPNSSLHDKFGWVKTEALLHGWTLPAKLSFEAYACTSWARQAKYGGSWYNAYFDLFNTAAWEAGGWDRIIVEEIGSSHESSRCENDEFQGEDLYSASLAVLANYYPSLLYGIWAYHDNYWSAWTWSRQYTSCCQGRCRPGPFMPVECLEAQRFVYVSDVCGGLPQYTTQYDCLATNGSDGSWGLRMFNTGVLSQGSWVIPYYFK